MAKRALIETAEQIEREANELKERFNSKKAQIKKVKIEVWECNYCGSYLDEHFLCDCDEFESYSPTEEEYHEDIEKGRIQFDDED